MEDLQHELEPDSADPSLSEKAALFLVLAAVGAIGALVAKLTIVVGRTVRKDSYFLSQRAGLADPFTQTQGLSDCGASGQP
jgi:hypothetical protein